MKRAILVLLLVLAGGTVPSGATFTTSSSNGQTFGAANDFAVHVSLVNPSPVSGTKTVSINASETAGGAITQVVVQRAPAGGGAWTTVCTDNNGAPWQCDWPTSGNGVYDLRALATNNSNYTRISETVSNVVVDNSAPSANFSINGQWVAGTLGLAVSNPTDTGGSGFASVTYAYKPSLGGTWTQACSSSTASTYSCNFNTSVLTNGQPYDFRATAADAAGNTTAVIATNKSVDNELPSGAVTDPGTNLRGTVPVSTSAADNHSGVASIAVQYAAAGTTNWNPACTGTSGPTPWTCNWNTTTVTSQMYDLRVIVTDVAGNQHTSTTLANKRVDNLGPTMGLTVTPATGTISGTVSMSATASDNSGGSGVQNVTFQYSVANADSWSTACGPIAPPTAYNCNPNTTAVADGLYDFRARGLDVAGNYGDVVVEDRRIDNFNPSATDVQTTNAGVQGVIEPGDALVLTYSEAIDPTSLIAGWNGVTQPTIYARMSHHNQGDRFLFYTTAALSTAIPLAGSPGVVLGEDYVGTTDRTFTATLTRSTDGKTFTIAFTAVPGANTTVAPAATMRWTPANGARDMVGKASGTAAINEINGATADRDF